MPTLEVRVVSPEPENRWEFRGLGEARGFGTTLTDAVRMWARRMEREGRRAVAEILREAKGPDGGDGAA